LPIADPHICRSDRESEIRPRGNPESEKPQRALKIAQSRHIVCTDRFENGQTCEIKSRHGDDEMVRTTTFADADEIPTVTVSIPHASVEMKGEFIGSGMRKGTASCQDLSEDAARTMQG